MNTDQRSSPHRSVTISGIGGHVHRNAHLIEKNVDDIVESFYNAQTEIPGIALLIGDADTLARLRLAQRRYILDLFSGFYDEEYVNNRLRIGMVHKRIGVEPKLYLSAIHLLSDFIKNTIRKGDLDREETAKVLSALEKVIFFDITLVFETYISSMLLEVQIEKAKSVEYAHNLEQIVRERTKQLDELSRTDPLTGLLNRRYLAEDLTRALRAAERRGEPISLAYFDVDNFKALNDRHGHALGDHVLETIGRIVLDQCTGSDLAYRYGGDEFCVVLPGRDEHVSRESFCEPVAGEVRARLPEVHLSFGIYTMGPVVYGEVAEMLAAADTRMYEAKKRARNESSSRDDADANTDSAESILMAGEQ